MFRNKRSYFLECIRRRSYENKEWGYSLFGVTELKAYDGGIPFFGQIFKTEDGKYQAAMVIPEDNVLEFIELDWFDNSNMEPVIKYNEKLTLEKGDIPNVKEKTETTYTKAWFNHQVLCRNFGDKIPYQNQQWSPRPIESLVIAKCKEGIISPKEYWDFVESAMHLTAYSQLFVPAATNKTLTVHPDVIKLRDKLIKEYKDQLDDPVIVAHIEKQVTALDKETFKGDRGALFLTSGKAFGIVRKRMYVMYGGEKSIEDPNKVVLVVPSLKEGLDTSKMSSMMNTMRGGINSRGLDTAKGGESAKFLSRLYQNCSIVKDDCNSNIGVYFPVTASNAHLFIGRYLLGKTQKSLTKADCMALIGKTVAFRSPMSCKCEKTDYCKKCIGDESSLFEKSLGIQAVRLGTRFQDIDMGAMHGKELKAEEYNWKELLW